MPPRTVSRRAPSGACSPRWVIASSVVVATLCIPGTVAATKSFPAVIKGEWAVTQLPVDGMGCRLCHTDDDGDELTQPFGKTVYSRGVRKNDNAALSNALETIRKYDYYFDSDRDGIGDYQEVAIDGTNPNDPKSFVTPPPPVGGGGEGGGSAEGGGGGDPGINRPPPPPFGRLPPPLEHGCSSSASRPGIAQGFWAFVAFALVAGVRRRRVQRRRG